MMRRTLDPNLDDNIYSGSNLNTGFHNENHVTDPSIDRADESRVQFMSRRLQKNLSRIEHRRQAQKNVKLLEARLKQQRAELPVHEKLRAPHSYDSSQQALNQWLRKNPLGK